ncbi:MAG: hypothetical protein HWN70_08855 [Desulfobacterales bacterium]|nr:hypothetical protein [Desulfobacterales bacterium]
MKSKCILLALAIFISFFGCQPKEPATFPGELLGVWKTSAPKYKDCFFELTENSIIFANLTSVDKAHVNRNSIRKIEKIQKEKRLLYTIHYEDTKGQEYKFPIYYDPSKGGAIRLMNQEQIEWRKMDIPHLKKLLTP